MAKKLSVISFVFTVFFLPVTVLATTCCLMKDTLLVKQASDAIPAPEYYQYYSVDVTDCGNCNITGTPHANLTDGYQKTDYSCVANSHSDNIGVGGSCISDSVGSGVVSNGISGTQAGNGIGGTPTGNGISGSSADCSNGVCHLPNPLPASIDSIPKLIGKVINSIMGIIGAICLVMFIIGGVTWLTAMGNDKTVAKGKAILVWAIVGMVVIFSSYVIVNFVIQTLQA